MSYNRKLRSIHSIYGSGITKLLLQNDCYVMKHSVSEGISVNIIISREIAESDQCYNRFLFLNKNLSQILKKSIQGSESGNRINILMSTMIIYGTTEINRFVIFITDNYSLCTAAYIVPVCWPCPILHINIIIRAYKNAFYQFFI